MKNWIIKKLGGYTEYDLKKEFVSGKAEAYGLMLNHMESIYGMPGDEFANHIYQNVKRYYRIFNGMIENGKYSE